MLLCHSIWFDQNTIHAKFCCNPSSFWATLFVKTSERRVAPNIKVTLRPVGGETSLLKGKGRASPILQGLLDLSLTHYKSALEMAKIPKFCSPYTLNISVLWCCITKAASLFHSARPKDHSCQLSQLNVGKLANRVNPPCIKGRFATQREGGFAPRGIASRPLHKLPSKRELPRERGQPQYIKGRFATKRGETSLHKGKGRALPIHEGLLDLS